MCLRRNPKFALSILSKKNRQNDLLLIRMNKIIKHNFKNRFKQTF